MENKKLNQLDLSPKSYKVEYAVLSKADKEILKKIKIKHNFKEDKNLFFLLESLPSRINAYQNSRREKGRSRIKRDLLTKTIKTAERLEEYLKFFSIEMRMDMRDEHLKKSICATFETVPKDLTNFINKCKNLLEKIPIDIGGRLKGSIPKELIRFLLYGYEWATDQYNN